MLGLRVEGRYHWGYWIRIPNTSKLQPSLSIPPPTTLIGALALPLIRGSKLKGGAFNIGELVLECNEAGTTDYRSGAVVLRKAVKACSIALYSSAMYWEDVNKYNTLLFQTLTKDTPEEKMVGGRRYLPRYLTGTIITGKVFYPSGKAVALYLLDEKALNEIIPTEAERVLEEAAWSITRIGSKESIFCVDKVTIHRDLEKVEGDTVTRFYFPSTAGQVQENQLFYRTNFWEGGLGRLDPMLPVEYIVPGLRVPIRTYAVDVKVCGSAYKFGGEEVLLVAE